MASFDVLAAIRSLELEGEGEHPAVDWLAEANRNPPEFWRALFEYAHAIAPLRSRPGMPQDIYHDAVARHAASGCVAFASYERGVAHALSFSQLDTRASAVAGLWAAQGVAAGENIALVLPVGTTLAIALAACLRLGLCTSLLVPTGPIAVQSRLKALGTSRVLCLPETTPLLGEFASLCLPFVDTGPPLRCAPYGYGPQEPCARLFSPLRSPLLKPVDLSAARAVENGLRDALFATRVARGDALAAPGFSPQQHLPALLLSTWLSGATFVEVPISDIRARPALLDDAAITTLGVGPSLEETLRRTPLPLRRVRHVFRSVDEPLDWPSFRELLRKNALDRVPSSNVLLDAAAGGCLLISAQRPGSASARVVPAPGRPFTLLDSSGSGEPAAGSGGAFAPLDEKGEPEAAIFLVGEWGHELLYGSTLQARRAARVYPADEVVARVTGIQGVYGAVVAPVAAGGASGRWAFHLLVFIGGSGGRPTVQEGPIMDVIRTDLGEDFLPDRVTVFSLHPRRVGDKVDVDWCQKQYAAGLLSRKARHPVFRHVTQIRDTMLSR